MHSVAVATTELVLDHVAGVGQVGDYAIGGAFGNAKRRGDVSQAYTWIAGDAQQGPTVGSEKAPVAHRSSLAKVELEHTNQGLIALHRELEEAREAEVRLRLAEAELAEVRTAQEILAERDRVAMDLHDRVIQRLFASGINLQAALGLADSPALRARLENVVEELALR